jgi:hypothetical protein
VIYLLVGAVVGTAAVLVRRSRLPSHPNDGGTRILEPGWQFYSRPTTLEPPGTVFRIDADQRRYVVDTLQVRLQTGDEAFGKHQESVAASLGILARLFARADVTARSAKAEQLVFELAGAAREVVGDVDLDVVLQPFLKDLPYRVDNRYFVIRAARTATQITYCLRRSQVDDLGGEASLAECVALQGSLFTSNSNGEFELRQTFDKPMRVMFLPEEIKPRTAGLGGASPQLDLVPVEEPLVWKDG